MKIFDFRRSFYIGKRNSNVGILNYLVVSLPQMPEKYSDHWYREFAAYVAKKYLEKIEALLQDKTIPPGHRATLEHAGKSVHGFFRNKSYYVAPVLHRKDFKHVHQMERGSHGIPPANYLSKITRDVNSSIYNLMDDYNKTLPKKGKR